MNKLFQNDFWKEILESVTTNGFRTLITAFGVFWGIFILIILLSAANGFEKGVKRSFHGVSTNTLYAWTQGVSMPYKGLPKGRIYDFNSKDTEAIRNNIEGLSVVSPVIQYKGMGKSVTVVREINEGSFEVLGQYPEIIEQEPLNLKQGRFINYGDLNDNKKVAVIGANVKKELFDDDEAVIGKYIKIEGVSFMVIGVFNKPDAQGETKLSEESQIILPFTVMLQAFNIGDKMGYYTITAKDGYSISEIKEEIFALLRKNHNIHPDDERAIGHFDLYEAYKQINSLFAALSAVSYFVGMLVLLSGVIGISNIMLIVIKERTKEIGVRRALGATPGNIRLQILTESVFLTLFSGMAGISFAALVVYFINVLLDKFADSETMFVNPSVNVTTIIASLIILVICGLFAGLIPAQNALKIKPIEALRTE